MALLRSLLFAAIFYPVSLLFVLGALPMALLERRRFRRYCIGWMRFHGWCARRLLGIRLRVEGAVPPGPMLFAAKHEAMFETIALAALLDEPIVVMKHELTAVPLWGWLARRYGAIGVDREAGGGALRRMLAAAKAARSEDRPILIFPEGTRVPPGEAAPLRPGFAGLYRALGRPVVPIAVDSGRLWPRGLVKRGGTITLRFGAAIPPGLAREEIETRVHAAINALQR